MPRKAHKDRSRQRLCSRTIRLETLEIRTVLSASGQGDDLDADGLLHGEGCCCGPCLADRSTPAEVSQPNDASSSGKLVNEDSANGHWHGDVWFKGEHHEHETVIKDGFIYDSRGNARFFDPPFYADDADPLAARNQSSATSNFEAETKVPLSDVPVLHSNPGAPNILYLDFDGEIIERTDWNLDFNNQPIHAAPFDVDDDFETWSETELEMIREVWLRVSEDFLPFDIDVTTEEPPAELLNNPRGAIRAMITTNYDHEALGGTGAKWHPDVGGVAYTSSWLIPDQAPVWSFYNLLPPNAKGIAEATTHEFGHAFGLVHHGERDEFGISEYYQGHGDGETSWAPIMGTGYTSNVTQWSRGDYTNASNQQDDLELITSSFNEVNFRDDDIWEGSDFAREIIVENGAVTSFGEIAEEWDYDTFALQHPGGPVNLHIAPAEVGPNLDVMVSLFDSDEDELAIYDPPDSVDVWLQTELEAGIYYLDVEGTRFIPDEGEGYSDYGSIGGYTISGHVGTPPLTVVSGGEYGWQEGTRYWTEEGADLSLDASTSYGPSQSIDFTWDLDGDGQFDDAAGVSPTIQWADLIALDPNFDSGEYEIAAQATDDLGNEAIGYATLYVANSDPVIEPLGAREVARQTPVRFDVTASDSPGDLLTYEWKVYSLEGDEEVELTLVETDTVPSFEYTFEDLGAFEVRVRVSDDDGGSSVETISVTVLNRVVEPLQGDLNLDGLVDFADFLALSQNFGRTDAEPSDGDITGDGLVDFADFLILSRNFGDAVS